MQPIAYSLSQDGNVQHRHQDTPTEGLAGVPQQQFDDAMMPFEQDDTQAPEASSSTFGLQLGVK
jgi:hypothetical protein